MERLHEIERKIEAAVEQYKTEVDKIRKSKDPIYKDRAKQDFEIEKLKKALIEEVEELKAQYQVAADDVILETEQAIALSIDTISPTDKNIVDSRLDEFVTDVSFAYSNDDKQAAFDSLLEKLKYFDRAKFIYLRKALPSVLERVGNDPTTLKNLRTLDKELKDLIKSPAEKRLEELRALKESGGDIAFRTLKWTHPTFGHKPIDVTR